MPHGAHVSVDGLAGVWCNAQPDCIQDVVQGYESRVGTRTWPGATAKVVNVGVVVQHGAGHLP